ncbi:MAG: transcription antitermination factor NusB [Flavobacteriales bacterium]|nr:transcription antitermination factor NusB [Flavobacteriales bacterium]
MLNRRYLRIKVLQTLYSWFQSESNDLNVAEKEMFKSINKVYDLYVYMLLLAVEVVESARSLAETKKGKHFVSEEEKNPNLHFTQNKAILLLENDKRFNQIVSAKKMNWSLSSDNVRRLFRTISESKEYEKYMLKTEGSFKEDRMFMAEIYEKYIATSEVFEQIIEDEDMYWAQDVELVHIHVSRTFQKMKEGSPNVLVELYKDMEDDTKFVKSLLRNTLAQNEEYGDLIASLTKNWESDRLAKIDIILMKMAVCEIDHFSTIPVKVTLNEYIDLSKFFSTPKSKGFINGVLDKIVAQWKSEGRIKKQGRGLIE